MTQLIKMFILSTLFLSHNKDGIEMEEEFDEDQTVELNIGMEKTEEEKEKELIESWKRELNK